MLHNIKNLLKHFYMEYNKLMFPKVSGDVFYNRKDMDGTGITVPGLRVCLVSPFLISVFGVPPSTIQIVFLLSSITSTCTQACGLIHSTLTIFPVKLTGALASNSAVKA